MRQHTTRYDAWQMGCGSSRGDQDSNEDGKEEGGGVKKGRPAGVVGAMCTAARVWAEKV